MEKAALENVLAVPFSQMRSVADAIGSNADRKMLVDATNAVGPKGQLAVGLTTSGADELQKMLPKARVVKAFNTVFAPNQSIGKVGNERLSALIAGDDDGAKREVMDLTGGIGFEPVDCGPLMAARYLEPMGMQIIFLAFDQGMGTNIGYRIVKG